MKCMRIRNDLPKHFRMFIVAVPWHDIMSRMGEPDTHRNINWPNRTHTSNDRAKKKEIYKNIIFLNRMWKWVVFWLNGFYVLFAFFLCCRRYVLWIENYLTSDHLVPRGETVESNLTIFSVWSWLKNYS